jgi:hypothetical protein
VILPFETMSRRQRNRVLLSELVLLMFFFLLLTPGDMVCQTQEGSMGTGPTGSDDHTFRPVTPTGSAFGVGELLKFSIKFGFIKAGTGVLQVHSVESIDGHPCHKIVSTAESNKFFSMFYRVQDRVISHMDIKTRFSRRFEQHLREGKYKADISVGFDHERLKAVYSDGREFDIPHGVQDALSALYYVRTLDLQVNDHILVDNHSNGKNYPLHVKVHRKETVETPVGTFDCIVVEPFLQSTGLFKQKGKLTVWLTDDHRKIPVLMRSEIPVGAITAELALLKTSSEE